MGTDSRWRDGLGIAIALLPAAAALATLAAAAYSAVQPVALDYAEPIIYGQAQRLVQRQALYQPLDAAPYTVAAYTPLYYAVGALLQLWIGPGFGAGRALSLLSGVVTAGLIGWLASRSVCRPTRAVGIGAFGALLFLALAFPVDRGGVPWLGLYRVDMLGVALSVAAIAILAWRTSSPVVVMAGITAGLAILCKPTFLAALLAGTAWLCLRRPRDVRLAVVYATSALLTVGVPCLLLQLTTGALVQNTVEANVNPFYVAVAQELGLELLRTQWLPLLLAGVYLIPGRPWSTSTSDGRLLVLYWVATAVSLIGIGKIGANHNYWIEFAAATAILAARGLGRLLALARPSIALLGCSIVGLLLVVQLGGPAQIEASLRAGRSDYQSARQAPPDPDFAALVDRVRTTSGDVLAEPMDVIVLGGRPILLEPFIYSIQLDVGRWRPDPVVDRICHGDVGLVVLAYPLEEGANMTDGLHALWPAPVMAAMQATMQLEGVQAGRFVYTPHARGGGEQCMRTRGRTLAL